MKNFVKAMNNLPLLVKILLALPALDIVWNITRLMRSIIKNNVLGIVLAVILLLPGVAFMWLIDIITLCFSQKIWWFD